MEFIFKHAWIILTVMTIYNGIAFKKRSKQYIAANNDLERGYDKLVKGWLIYGNLPWVVMAIGDLTGITNSIEDYTNPKSLNPMVLVFHFSIILLWLLGSNWIFLKNGANFLAKHPGLITFHGPGINKDITSPLAIKIFWCLGLAGGIAGMTMLWFINFPAVAGQ
ncbi:MAG: hypothetical protein K0S09_1898 [Sphingobacteriaceae bacterium]|jgi:hypothetical protein|nr:hypothetical protein [Sphingobacteriaceae bacterium]